MADAPAAFGFAALASTFSGIMRVGVLILLFRILRNGGDVEVKVWEFAAAATAAVVSGRVAAKLLQRIARKSFTQLRLKLAQQVAAAPLIDLEALGSSQLITCLTRDVSQVAGAASSLVQMFTSITTAVMCLVYLGWLSPLRLFLILVIISAGILLYRALQRKRLDYMRVSRRMWDDLVQALRTLIDGAKELRLNTQRQRQVLEMFQDHATELQRLDTSQSADSEGFVVGLDVLFFLALGLAVFGISAGATSPDVLIGYTMSIIYLMGPLRGIAGSVGILRGAGVALERVQELGFQLTKEHPYPVALLEGGEHDTRGACWRAMQRSRWGQSI
jgi:putative ATP-binding cassette transporter